MPYVNIINTSIVLVSSNFKILLVLRTFRPTVPPGADPEKFQYYEIGAHYATLEYHFVQPHTHKGMTLERLQSFLNAQDRNEEDEAEEMNALLPHEGVSEKKNKYFKKRKQTRNTIRKVLLNGAAEYGAQLIEQVVRMSAVNGDTLVSDIPNTGKTQKLWTNIDDSPVLLALLEQFFHADDIIKACGSPPVKGYITSHPPKDPTTIEPIYDEFMPFHPTNTPSTTSLIEFETVTPQPVPPLTLANASSTPRWTPFSPMQNRLNS